MKSDQITNALELFYHSCMFESMTPDSVRNANRNHAGYAFDNKPQYIAMDKGGKVYSWCINPAALISGSAVEGQHIEMFCDGGVWESRIGTVSEYIGQVALDHPILLTPEAACFRIDESFTEVERVDCACCNGHGQVSEMMREDGVCCDDEWVDVQCPDCLGAGSVPNGKV